MALCPACNAEIVDDFGLIECGQCGAQLIVHMDGQVERSQGSPSDEVAESLAEGSRDLEKPDIFAEEEGAPGDMPPVFELELGSADHGANDATRVAVEAEAEPAAAFERASEPEFEPEPTVYRTPSARADSPDLSDIAAFGNSDVSSGRDGALRYTLHIQGVDTADIRESLREALTDRKFLWDADKILRSIRGGEVRITDVSASKAFILISRLRSLPVRIQWEQHAVHQA